MRVFRLGNRPPNPSVLMQRKSGKRGTRRDAGSWDQIAGPFGDVRVGPLLPVPALLAERGIDPARVLAEVGLDSRLFEDPENRVPFDDLGRLIETCVALTGCPHFGLLIGEQFHIEALGLLGDLMRNSPTIRDALRLATQHLEIHDRGSVAIALDLGHSRAALGYALFAGKIAAADQILDGAIAMQVQLLRRLCGPSWKPLLIQLSHSRPRNVAPLRRWFGANLEFDAMHSAIVFDARWLDQPIAGADPARFEALIGAIESSKPNEAGSFVWQVRRAIYALTFSGVPSSASIAALFGLHERTLRRRLGERGATVRGLVSGVRRELAQHLLRDTDLSVTEVSAVLSYADPTVFARAFRGWTNMNPREWRAQAAPAR
jgi:AraC-like DNA-binding protein